MTAWRHSHGPLRVPFCRQCRKARKLGLRYAGRMSKGLPSAGQRMYAGPPVHRTVAEQISFDEKSARAWAEITGERGG